MLEKWLVFGSWQFFYFLIRIKRYGFCWIFVWILGWIMMQKSWISGLFIVIFISRKNMRSYVLIIYCWIFYSQVISYWLNWNWKFGVYFKSVWSQRLCLIVGLKSICGIVCSGCNSLLSVCFIGFIIISMSVMRWYSCWIVLCCSVIFDVLCFICSIKVMFLIVIIGVINFVWFVIWLVVIG